MILLHDTKHCEYRTLISYTWYYYMIFSIVSSLRHRTPLHNYPSLHPLLELGSSVRRMPRPWRGRTEYVAKENQSDFTSMSKEYLSFFNEFCQRNYLPRRTYKKVEWSSIFIKRPNSSYANYVHWSNGMHGLGRYKKTLARGSVGLLHVSQCFSAGHLKKKMFFCWSYG
jgi:hypothetical protein